MDVWQDVRFAIRILTKNRWFAFAAAATLGCGVGACITAFAVVNAMTRGLPVDAPDRMVQISPRSASKPLRLSTREWEDWRAAKTLEGIGAQSQGPMTLGSTGRSPEPVTGAYLSANSFPLLGETPALGRNFVPEEDMPGAPAVAILGGAIWRTRFDSDPAIVGRTLVINGAPATVVGVMREGFRFPMVSDLWMPLGAMPGAGSDRNARAFDGFARLAPGVSIAQAQAELDPLAARLETDLPEAVRAVGVTIAPYTGDDRSLTPFFSALMGSVAFVLLIGCVNVANLLFARAVDRSRETAIRLAHGASRWRVIRQLVIEGAVLALLAGVIGFALTALSLRMLSDSLAGINFPYWMRWTMDGRVYGFGVLMAVLSALTAAVWPAVMVAKTSMSDSLKESGRSDVSGWRTGRLGAALLVGEVAFTLILLAGAGLMMRSFLAVYRADLIINPAVIASTRLALPPQSYRTPEQRNAFFNGLQERLQAIPAVAATTMTSDVPFVGSFRRELTIEGRPVAPGQKRPNGSWIAIGPGYFKTLGVDVVRGRVFDDRDGTPGNEAAIVNERFAAMYFPGEDPIGKRITAEVPRGQPLAAPRTIVGISPSVRQQPTLAMNELDAVVYVPRPPASGPVAWLMVRGTGDVKSLVPLIR